MNINQLILIVKKKINKNFLLESINIEDKTFLHKDHKTNQEKVIKRCQFSSNEVDMIKEAMLKYG